MQKFVIILLLFCNIIDEFVCETSEKLSKNKELVQDKVKLPEAKKASTKKGKILEQILKPYEVFEDVSEYIPVPLPYHIQKQLIKYKDVLKQELLTAESKYNENTSTYEVTENVNEVDEVKEAKNKKDNKNSIKENTKNNDTKVQEASDPEEFERPHIQYSSKYPNFNQRSPLHTRVVYENEAVINEPISVILLPKSYSNRPIILKILQPIVLGDQNDKFDNRNNNYGPILNQDDVDTNQVDYQDTYHRKNTGNQENNQPILIKVLKKSYQATNKYKNIYDSLLNDGFNSKYQNENSVYYTNKNIPKEYKYKSKSLKTESNNYAVKNSKEYPLENPENKERYLVYINDNQEPYIHVRRANTHR